jgi:hypothetical protein
MSSLVKRIVESTSNFNLVWDCGKGQLDITVKLEWNFASGISPKEQGQYRDRFTKAVLSKWNSHGYQFEAQRAVTGKPRDVARRETRAAFWDPVFGIPLDTAGLPAPVRFRFRLIESSCGEHWDVEVSRRIERANVDRALGNINVGLEQGEDGGVGVPIDDRVLQHEFGHALGLPDEYSECVHGEKGWSCHAHDLARASEHFGDVTALMNVGTQLRARYFFGFGDLLNEWTNSMYQFELRSI